MAAVIGFTMEDTMVIELFLTLLGFVVGIFSGLLGIGGGVLMVPALVFLPSLLGIHPYTVHMATGIAAVQGFVGGLSSFATHYRKGAVLLSLIGPLALGSVLGGLLGGIVSGLVSALFLYSLFAVILLMTLVAAFFFPAKDRVTTENSEVLPCLPWRNGVLVGGGISFLAANTGIGGAVLLLPFLIYTRHIPIRLAIGTAAGIVVVTSLSAVIGKALVHLVPFADAFWVSGGALLGGAFGARLSHHLSPVFLKRLLLVMVAVALVRVLVEIFQILSS